MTETKAILTADLFPILEGKLIELLRCLRHDDWSRPTLAKQWTVKDVAAHLLDGSIKRLSMQRDGYFGLPAPSGEGHEAFVAFINRNNAEWVLAARRLSPQVLIELLEVTSKQLCEFLRKLDPFAPALWGVSWAGEEQSANWFDVAREYTERWHHQQQIREAVNRPGITGRELYFPVLDTFMRGLPYTFRSIKAPSGTALEIAVVGEAGGSWFLVREESSWELVSAIDKPEARLRIDQELAWRVFTKGVEREIAERQVDIAGDRALAIRALALVAIIG